MACSKKTSPIWTTSTNDLSDIVDKSDTVTEILTRLKVQTLSGGNLTTLKNRCAQDNIDISRFHRKISKVRLISQHDFEILVSSSNTYTSILTGLGYDIATGGPLRMLKKRMEDDNIDISHLEGGKGQGWAKGLERPETSRPLYTLDEILVENSTYVSNKGLKSRLRVAGLLGKVCSICNLPPMWNGKKLVLQLDHINGNSIDNRIENLRMLCPNCHSQTDTFCRQKNSASLLNKVKDLEI